MGHTIDSGWLQILVRAHRLAEYSAVPAVDLQGVPPPSNPAEKAIFDELATQFALRQLTSEKKPVFGQPVTGLLLAIDRGACQPHFRVASIAAELGVSMSTVSRQLKVETGLSVLELVHRRRITCAKQLLAATRLTVKEVAARTGFDSTASLDTWFLALTGLSPSKFRKSL
jgi:AraC-like DNA-binding protein